MFNIASDFFGSIFIPMFKVGGVIFLIIFAVLGSVILWQKMRDRAEYKQYLKSQEK